MKSILPPVIRDRVESAASYVLMLTLLAAVAVLAVAEWRQVKVLNLSLWSLILYAVLRELAGVSIGRDKNGVHPPKEAP